MIDPAVFLGLPLKFREICTIYPPKVKDIINNPKTLQLYKLLTYSQEDIEDLFNDPQMKKEDRGAPAKKMPTPLEFLLINCYKSAEFKKLIDDAFEFLIHEPITLLYENKLILIGAVEDLSTLTDIKQFRYLSEDTFFDFQNVLREAIGAEKVTLPDPNEDPITKRVKAARRRGKRLAEKNRAKNEKGASLTLTLGAICCMGIGLTPLNIGEISYASIEVIMTLYQQKEKYQTDIDSLMAGADPKKVHPKYWIRENSDFKEIKI